jgi:subtilisin family serine protease
LGSLGRNRGIIARLDSVALRRAVHHAAVRYVEQSTRMLPDAAIQYQTVPVNAWHLDRIDQQALGPDGVYSYRYAGAGVRIWIVDTGVDAAHPDLIERVDQSSFVSYNGTNPFAPCFWHGTPVAVVAAGTNFGVAKAATINVARVSDDCNSGAMSSAAVVSAIYFIADYSPRPAVINTSFGSQCPWYNPWCASSLVDAVNYAQNRGVPVIASAGNDGSDACDHYPARVASLAVGASDQSDSRVANPFWTSSYGACVDLFAPGISIGVAASQYFEGTSAAAPLVTGVVALWSENNSPADAASALITNSTKNLLSNIGSGSPNRLLYSHFVPRVSIVGPDAVHENVSCSWGHVASGWTQPVALSWSINGAQVSTSANYSTFDTGNSSFTLELTLIDADSRVGFRVLPVTVSGSGTFSC